MIRLIRIIAALTLTLLVMLGALLIDLMQQRMSNNSQVVARSTVHPGNEQPSPTPRLLSNATRWFPESIAISSTATATATPILPPITTVTTYPTFTPNPTIVPQSSSASFVPLGETFMHNVLVALNANNGALRRVVVPPGETFSFIANLGPQPHWLPWRNVYIRTTAGDGAPPERYDPAVLYTFSLKDLPTAVAPTTGEYAPVSSQLITTTRPPIGLPQVRPTLDILPPAVSTPADSEWSPETTDTNNPPVFPSAVPEPSEPTAVPPPTATSGPVSVPVLGGGVCDLASRYVVAARPLLPDHAFRFKLHPNGLSGIDHRDAVSIWFEGRSTDLDLLITNTTDRWLIFEADVTDGVVTVTATLQGSP